MRLQLTVEQRQFHERLDAWLAANDPGTEPVDEDEAFEFRRAWQARLYRAGWLGLTCPVEYGGQGLTAYEVAVFNELLVRHKLPRPANLIGLEMSGPTILSHGTELQKSRFLPPLLSGEEIWCQGFSEPNAGSDLAALRTRAVRDGDNWIVNGQKVWTSFAHEARWCQLLVRTDPSVSSHAGLTCLIVDMRAPGVTVRRIDQINGLAEFNEVFFDDVRVPVTAVLGAECEGWRVAVTTLMHERANLAFTLAIDVEAALLDLGDAMRALADHGRLSPVLADRLAQLTIEAEILTTSGLNALLASARGRPLGAESALGKWRWAEVNQAVCDLAMDVLGVDPGDTWRHRYLRSRANSIEGGTTDILRNVVAERVLGLPRGA